VTEAKTTYKLVSTPREYTLCHEFLREENVKFDGLSFPTVVAFRGLQMVGLISTVKDKDAVVAGPIHISVDGNPSFVMIRLVEAYENVLRRAGLTQYLFWTDNSKLKHAVSRIGELIEVKPTGGNGDITWFKRNLWVAKQ